MEAKQVTIVAGCNASVNTFKVGDNWEIYEERLEQLFAANLIEEERKVSVLLTSISIEVYEILRNTCDPVKPSSCTYEELVSHLTRHFCARIPVYRRRIEFDNLRQLPQEKVMEWYVRLKKTASKCAFGNNMDEFLKNKFVTGMLPGKVQDRLCEEEASENLKRMVEIALNKEAVVRETGGGVDVNKLSKLVKKEKSVR
ncbi:hypothetical protein WA026_009055 [Henosepilachna vigintioctopunctata]|uniref:Retrotransposon gag domain-containing protein n=1 Tax=Henosepilachna vigintioctopunctata TaxID=420089 RepID=A0AAW1UQK6_9CUCU